MAQRYCTMLRQALSRLVRVWSASRPTTSVKLLAGITSILLLNGWFSSALAGEVKLAWDTPTGYTNGTQGRALAGYRLYVQDTTGGTRRVDEVGKQTTYTLTGLTEGRTYAIAVTALDTSSTGNESGKSNTITVSVPRTQSEVATTPVGTSATIAALANDTSVDGNRLTLTAETQGVHGTVIISGTSVIYRAADGFVGTDLFTYTIVDAQGVSTTATVTMNVMSGNHPPIASADMVSIPIGTSVTVSVLTNDSDVDGSPLTITAETQGAHGTVTRQSTSVTYPPGDHLRRHRHAARGLGKPSKVTNAWRDVIFKGDNSYYLMATSPTSSRPTGGGRFGGASIETFGTAALPTNTWTHLAVTYDGAALRLYVNGVQVASLAQTGHLVPSANPLQIGGDSLYGQYFQGTTDEVRIYNQALSASEIQADMGTPLP